MCLRSPWPLAVLLVCSLASACSVRYDPDELPSGDGDGATSDASSDDDGIDAGDGVGGEDAAPDATPLPDAAQNPGNCGDLAEMCCETDPICGFGDEFIECNSENNTCEACGHTSEPCCNTGPRCAGALGCVKLLGVCLL
jgi:hypothetical protein